MGGWNKGNICQPVFPDTHFSGKTAPFPLPSWVIIEWYWYRFKINNEIAQQLRENNGITVNTELCTYIKPK